MGAAIHYYKKLAEVHEKRGMSMNLVMVHAESPLVFEFVQAGDREGLAEYLRGFIHRLQAAGAEFAVVPAVTPHFCIRELIATSPLPLINIFDPLNRDLSARSIRRAAVFGTRSVMQSDLFGMVSGVELIRAQAAETDYIHNTYTELVQRGEGSDEQYRALTNLAQTLCSREGVDAIILAGTDLTLLFNESNTHFPHVDCAALQLRDIENRLFG